MSSRQHTSATLWLTGAGVALAFALSAAAALSALGPVLIGLQLIVCEIRARRFRLVSGLEDLAAPGTPLGDGLARVKAAEARAREEGARRGLPLSVDGAFLEDRDGRGEDLNLRLAHLFTARRELAHDFDFAARRWSSVMAWRGVTRLAVLLFIGAMIGLCLFEPPAGGTGGWPALRLALSAAAAVAGFAVMRLASRAAALALTEGLWTAVADHAGGDGDAPAPHVEAESLKRRLFLQMAAVGASSAGCPPDRRGEPVWSGRNHYQLLGLDPQAEPFLIEPVYRAQMRRRHPDRGGDTAHAQAINEAYRVLRNPDARARYDAELARAAAAEASAPAADLAEAAPRRGAGLALAAYVGLGAALVAGGVLSLRAPVETAAGALAGGVARAQTPP